LSLRAQNQLNIVETQMGFSIKLRKKVLSLWLDHQAVCRSHSGTRRSDLNSGHGFDRCQRRKRHSAIVETRLVVRFGVRTNRRGFERLSHRFEEHENHKRRGDFGRLGETYKETKTMDEEEKNKRAFQ
jgi:hypothetical protein